MNLFLQKYLSLIQIDTQSNLQSYKNLQDPSNSISISSYNSTVKKYFSIPHFTNIIHSKSSSSLIFECKLHPIKLMVTLSNQCRFEVTINQCRGYCMSVSYLTQQYPYFSSISKCCQANGSEHMFVKPKTNNHLCKTDEIIQFMNPSNCSCL